MRRALVLVVSSALISVVLVTVAVGKPGDEPGKKFDRIADAFNFAGFEPAMANLDRQVKVIAKLKGQPVALRVAAARGQGRSLSAKDKAAIRAELRSQQRDVAQRVEGLGGTVLADYQDAYNGLAVRLALKDVPALTALPQVESIHAVRIFQRDNTAGVQYIEGNDAWNDVGVTGAGVKVAVLDTGVDYFHAHLGGSGDPDDFANDDGTIVEEGTFPTDKVVAGTDLVGDDYDASSDDPAVNTPNPDPDPKDCNGHGSHVAGTAAGFGVLSDGSTYGGPYDATTFSNSFRVGPGVAPEALVIAIRVFGCTGSSSEEVIVDAIDTAVELGADVINMSLGSVFGRTDEPSAEASDNAAQAGVVVVAAAGNAGSGAYIADAPGIADRVLSAAAIDAFGPTFPGAILGLSTGQNVTAINANAATLPGGSLPVAVLRTSYPSGPVSLGCDPAEYAAYPGGVTGKLVVTQRGVCARVARAIFGQQAEAAAVVMINNAAGFPPFEGTIRSNPDTGEPFNVTIPFLGVQGPITSADAVKVIAADGGTTTLTAATVPNPGFMRLAGFTSGGPRNVDSAPKPEVTAPGVSVLSTGVGTGTEGAHISGTSMATPMTAGVAALVTEAHPTWPTDWIKGAIMNTANATSAKIALSGSGAYDPRRAGTGVVDARKAVDTIAFATTGEGRGTLAFGYEPIATAPYSETLSFTINNQGNSSLQFDLSAAFVGNALGTSASISPNKVTVSGGGTRTVDVTLSIANPSALPGATASNFGGIQNVRGAIVAVPKGNKAGAYTLRVPFVLVPRGLSNVTAGAPDPYTNAGGSLRTTSVDLTNSGIHSGTADVYAWGITDPDDVTGGEDAVDVRAVGVQSLPGEVLDGDPSDRSLIFAVNTFGQWSNPSVSEIDIAIDLQNDGNADFFVIGVDLGAVLAGAFNGQFASFIFDADFNLINAWVAIAPMNGSALLLPTLASDIGLSQGADSFNYAVGAFSIVPSSLVDLTGAASFRSHDPPVSSGDFIGLAPGGSAELSLTVDKAKNSANPQLGWLVVTHDDANGAAQADTVPIGNP